MQRNPEKSQDVLEAVRKLLHDNKPGEAAALLKRFGTSSPALVNAHGVALMRADDPLKAVEVFRRLCISEGGICLRPNLPLVFKTNFATALLLSGNVAGCTSLLEEIGERNDPRVRRLREVIRNWRRSLPRWQRWWFQISGSAPKTPVPFDEAPGDFPQDPDLRPAA